MARVMSRNRSHVPLSPIERLAIRIEMAEDNIRQIRRQQNDMESQWQQFAPAVADHISTKVIIPAMVQGLMRAIQVPPTLEMKNRADPLSLEDFDIEKFKKEKG